MSKTRLTSTATLRILAGATACSPLGSEAHLVPGHGLLATVFRPGPSMSETLVCEWKFSRRRLAHLRAWLLQRQIHHHSKVGCGGSTWWPHERRTPFRRSPENPDLMASLVPEWTLTAWAQLDSGSGAPRRESDGYDQDDPRAGNRCGSGQRKQPESDKVGRTRN